MITQYSLTIYEVAFHLQRFGESLIMYFNLSNPLGTEFEIRAL